MLVSLFTSALGAAPARAASPPFFAERVISTNASFADSVFAADVDGDGDMDVLSASGSDDKIAWYENTGVSVGTSSPSFAEHVISTSASGARSVFTADVDGDGDIDVLSASRFDDKIAWYENTGSNGGASPPSFVEHIISTNANTALSVFAADVDGDGDMDVLSASFIDDKIAWYENTGPNGGASPPSFTEHVISISADGACSVFAADMDGDGDMDVLSASELDDTIAWYENTGPNGGVTPPNFVERIITIYANGVVSVFAADVDGDGDTDVLSASILADKVAWYENTGPNSGASPLDFTEHFVSMYIRRPNSVYAKDMDGDGDVDILSASYTALHWYENDGALPAGFTQHVVSPAHNTNSIFAADVDGDGDIDVLSASARDNKIAWHQQSFVSNQITGEVFTRFLDAITAARPGDVLLAESPMFIFDPVVDLNSKSITLQSRSELAQPDNGVYTLADGAVLAVAPGAEMKLTGALNAPAGAVALLSAGSVTLATTSFATIGVDAALLIDSPSVTSLSGQMRLGPRGSVVLNNGAISINKAAFTNRITSTNANGARSIFAADVNGDGDIDVLSASAGDDKIAWYENTGPNGGVSPPSFIEHVIATNADGASSVFAADMDGDGDMDVLSASSNDDKIAWYENDGMIPPSFTGHVVSTTADGAQSVFAADVDGDGDMDVFSASYNDNKIAWYESDGLSPPSFTEHVVSTNAPAGAFSVFAVDVDGDGDVDLLSASLGDKVAWYENTGPNGGVSPPSFIEHVIATNADGASSVFAADVDGDGDMDVLSASSNDDKIAWYENTGPNGGASPPSFTPHVISTTADRAQSVFAADVDGDGDIDVLSASQGDDKIAWYENTGPNSGASPPSFTEHVITQDPDGPPTTHPDTTLPGFADGARSVFAADMDGDGDMDVLSASASDDKIAWYEQMDLPLKRLAPDSRFVTLGSFVNKTGLALDRATVEVTPSADGAAHLMNLAPGVVGGFGDILADVKSSGKIRPGGVAGSVSGVLTIQGDYAQFSDDLIQGRRTGELFIDIAGSTPGTGHDALSVTGAADLAGGLFVSLANGFAPRAGDRFTILTAGSIGASIFDAAFLPALPDDPVTGKPLVMRVEYNRNATGVGDSIELVVVQACPADLDSNGAVGVFDLSLLLGFWGTSDLTTDLNNDGAVNVFDLAELIGAWGPCL